MLGNGGIHIIAVEKNIELMAVTHDKGGYHIVAYSGGCLPDPVEDIVFIHVMAVEGGAVDARHAYYVRCGDLIEVLLLKE